MTKVFIVLENVYDEGPYDQGFKIKAVCSSFKKAKAKIREIVVELLESYKFLTEEERNSESVINSECTQFEIEEWKVG